MSASTVHTDARPTTEPADPFDLDVDVLERSGGNVPLIVLTDDGCKPSCPESCATNVA